MQQSASATTPDPTFVPSGLGFGGSGIGNLGSAIDDDRAVATIERAWNRGVRYFDTAPHYGLGLSERRLGMALSARRSDGYLISTKVGRLLVPRAVPLRRDDAGFHVAGDLERQWDFSLDGVRRSLSESCERLGVDRIDVAFVHDPDQAWPGAAELGLRSLAALKSQGLVGAIGVGTNRAEGLAELIDDGSIDVVMIAGRYTLLDHRSTRPLLAAARRANVAVVAAGVFNSGLLATTRPTGGATFDYRPPSDDVMRRLELITDVCDAHGVDVPTVAIAFAARHPAVSCVVIGMRSEREVDENLDRFETSVPDGLWPDLVSAGLIDADVTEPPP